MSNQICRKCRGKQPEESDSFFPALPLVHCIERVLHKRIWSGSDDDGIFFYLSNGIKFTLVHYLVRRHKIWLYGSSYGAWWLSYFLFVCFDVNRNNRCRETSVSCLSGSSGHREDAPKESSGHVWRRISAGGWRPTERRREISFLHSIIDVVEIVPISVGEIIRRRGWYYLAVEMYRALSSTAYQYSSAGTE